MMRSNWRYNATKDDDNESSTVESDTEYENNHNNNNDLVYSDDDDDDDDEEEEEEIETNLNIGDFYLDSAPPTNKKPFNFHSPSRITGNVAATPTTTATPKRAAASSSSSSRYVLTEDDLNDENDDQNIDTINVQQFPPIQAYRNPKAASVSSLWALSMRQSPQRNNSSRITDRSSNNDQISINNNNNNNNINNNRIEIVVVPGIEDDIHRLTQLLQQVQMTSTESNTTAAIQQYQNTKRVYDLQKERQQIRREMEKIQQQLELQHQQAKDALQQLIQQQERTANEIRNAMIAQQEQQEKEEQQERERQQIEDEEQRRRAAEKKEPDPTVTARIEVSTPASATVDAAAAVTTPLGNEGRQPEETIPKSTTSQIAAVSTSNTATAAADGTAEPPEEYITRAAKLRSQLIDLERNVLEYDNATDPVIKQKRLQFKKLVNGKVNTLAENVVKIREVAQEVITAITNAKSEDAQYKASASTNNKVHAIGKRYLVNLLSSKVIVRIQAEGFNGYVLNIFMFFYVGDLLEWYNVSISMPFFRFSISNIIYILCLYSQRGDGFPLAHMLSIVAANVKDIIPVLTAHIYTVCPTAIPTLPSTTSSGNNNNSDEDDFMIQLGMIRQKDGNFESFERFLSRTEVWYHIRSITLQIFSTILFLKKFCVHFFFQFFFRGSFHL
jgi:GLE1-like protein